MYARLKASTIGLLQTVLDWETEFRDRGLEPTTTGEPAADERFAMVIAAVKLRPGR